MLGGIYENSIAPEKASEAIPLPAGKWKLVGWTTEYNNVQVPHVYGLLIQEKNGLLDKVVRFQNTVGYAPNGYQEGKFCQRKNIHHLVVKANYNGREQDCWGVNHFRMTLNGRISEDLVQARDYIVKNELTVPINFLYVHYRKASSTKLWRLDYFFNPEAEGFPPPKYADWATSDWHRDRAYMDAKKVLYIEKLKSWGTAWNETVDSAFHGKNLVVSAPSSVPVSTESELEAPASQSLEDKLFKLKKLYEKNLITADEYADKKRALLEKGM